MVSPRQCWIAHALVVRDGRALLLHRNEGRYLGGFWDIPGGAVEADEQPAAAAAREVLEETGLDVVILDQLNRVTNPDTRGRSILFHTITYTCTENSASQPIALAPDEHSAFAWASREEARDYDLVWHVERSLDEAARLGFLR